VTELSARFNAASHWIAACVLWPERLSERVRVLVRLVDLAAALEALGNYNAMFEVLAGLANSAVHRLRFTFQELPRRSRDTLARLHELWDSAHNFRSYREALKQRPPPKFPYLSVYLQDLTHIEDGNSDLLPSGLLNFSKRRLLYRVLRDVEQHQQASPGAYEFTAPPNSSAAAASAYLAELPQLDEEELFRLSLQREPRNVESKSTLK